MYYLSIDTGTTNTRATVWDEEIEVYTAFRPVGVRMTSIEGNNHTLVAAIRECVEESLKSSNISFQELGFIVASGMITSNLGVCEVPHIKVPASVQQLAEGTISKVIPEITLEKEIYFVPVSYTHLDVYKRQHEHLVLKRKISTHLGAKKLWIHDTVENLGFTREAIMLLYHMNFGYPLLNKNSRILTPLSEVELYANATGTTADSFWHSGNPVDGGLCDTFFHRLAVDKDKFTSVALINDSLSLGVYLRYSIVEFPMLVEWRNLVSGDYSVALEPCTQYPLNRLSEKAKKDMVFLNPLKSRKYRIEMGILEGKKEIEQFEEQISEYQLP